MALRNNLTLNRAKTRELIFVDKKHQRQFDQPLGLPEVARVASLKVLGVTWTNGLFVSDHVGGVITVWVCAEDSSGLWNVLRCVIDCLPNSF
jgi:hypothetical protein